jgi:hypothetical protein
MEFVLKTQNIQFKINFKYASYFFSYEVIVVRNGLRKHPYVINNFVCKSLSFAESLCAISSIYLLIAMTIDKLICVLIPLKVGQLLTPAKARIIVTCILITSALISSYQLFDKRMFLFEADADDEPGSSSSSSVTTTTAASETTATITSIIQALNQTSGNTQQQQQQPKTKKRISYDCDSNWPNFKNDWTLINNIIRVFIPFCLLCICNSWIAVALAKATRNTEALFANRDNEHSSTHRAEATASPASPTATSQQFFKKTFKKNKNTGLHLAVEASSQATPAGCRSNSMDAGYLTDPDQYEFSNNGKKMGAQSVKLSRNRQHKNSIHMSSNRHIASRANTNQHISIMLLAVSVGFILLNLPFAIRTLFHRQFSENFKLLDYIYHDDNMFKTRTSKTEIENTVKYEFFSSITHLLLDLNYIANFFLYFFSGSRFRSQLYAMFKCQKEAKTNMNFTNAHFINKRGSVKQDLSTSVGGIGLRAASLAAADSSSVVFMNNSIARNINDRRRSNESDSSKTLSLLKKKLFMRKKFNSESNSLEERAPSTTHIPGPCPPDSPFLNIHYKSNNRFVGNNSAVNNEIVPFLYNDSVAAADANNTISQLKSPDSNNNNGKSEGVMRNSEF